MGGSVSLIADTALSLTVSRREGRPRHVIAHGVIRDAVELQSRRVLFAGFWVLYSSFILCFDGCFSCS